MATLCELCNLSHYGANCDREVLKGIIKKLREDLRVRTMEVEATRKLGEKGVIMIRSLISHRTQKPRIDIQVGEIHTQMSTDAAMDVAKNIIECAMGSYADAFIFHFLTEKLEQPPGVGGQIIQEFREYRDKLAEEFRDENQQEEQ